MEFLDDGSHDVEDLGLTRVRHVVAVIQEDGFQKTRNKALVDHLKVVRLFDVDIDEF